MLCAGGRACESGIRKQIRAVRRSAERFPFAIERTSEKDPTLAGLVQAIKRIEPIALLVGQRARGPAVIVISFIGVGPGVALQHRDLDRLSATGASARQQSQHDTGSDCL